MDYRTITRKSTIISQKSVSKDSLSNKSKRRNDERVDKWFQLKQNERVHSNKSRCYSGAVGRNKLTDTSMISQENTRNSVGKNLSARARKSMESQIQSCKSSFLKSYELSQTSLKKLGLQQSPPKPTKQKGKTPKKQDEGFLPSPNKNKGPDYYYATAKNTHKHTTIAKVPKTCQTQQPTVVAKYPSCKFDFRSEPSEIDTTTFIEMPQHHNRQSFKQMLIAKNVLSSKTRNAFKKTMSARNVTKGSSLLPEASLKSRQSPVRDFKSIFAGIADTAVEAFKDITKQGVRNEGRPKPATGKTQLMTQKKLVSNASTATQTRQAGRQTKYKS